MLWIFLIFYCYSVSLFVNKWQALLLLFSYLFDVNPHNILWHTFIFDHGPPLICACNLNYLHSPCYCLFVLLELSVFAPVIALFCLRDHLSLILSYLRETQGLNKLCSIWMIHVPMVNSRHHHWESSFVLLSISCACSGNEEYIDEKISLIIHGFIKEIAKGIMVFLLRWCLTWRPEMTNNWPILNIFMLSANGSYTVILSFHEEAFYCMIATPTLIEKRLCTASCAVLC